MVQIKGAGVQLNGSVLALHIQGTGFITHKKGQSALVPFMGLEAHSSNLSTWEAKTGRSSQERGQPTLHSETLVYVGLITGVGRWAPSKMLLLG